MDKTMERWHSSLKHKIVKNDDFIEDFGYINDADISNWFKTLEQTFDDMLSNIGVGDIGEFRDTGQGFEISRRESYNKKKIILLGNEIAAEILTTGIEEWMTESAEYMEDDSERSISNLLGSPEYNTILTSLYEGAEYLISHIFDTAHIGARTQHDIPYEELEDETIDIPIDKILDPSLINDINAVTQKGVEAAIRGSIKTTSEEIENELAGPKKELGDKVANAVLEKIKTKLVDPIRDIVAYAFQSFIIKLPIIQQIQEQSSSADQSTMPPDDELYIKDKDDYDRKRQEFEDHNASEYHGEYVGELNWQSVLSKKAGIGLTSGASFSPSEHNITYGDKPACDKCEDKTTSCGCGK